MEVLLPIARVLKVCDPFSNPWTDEPFTVEDVKLAIAENRLREISYSKCPNPNSWTTQMHIERIAFLAVRGWTGAIAVDVGVPRLGCYVSWPVQDGNHRMAAGVVRGDQFILSCVGGSVDYAFELFGVDISGEPASEADAGTPGPKNLEAIIRANPGAVAIVDNDSWRLYKSDPYAAERESTANGHERWEQENLLATDRDIEPIEEGLGGGGYGGDLLTVLAKMAGIEVQGV